MDELYVNDLIPLATEWITLSLVIGNLSQVDQDSIFIPVRDPERGIYYFAIRVDGKLEIYDFYNILGEEGGGRRTPKLNRLLPESASKSYLIEAMRILNTYRESLNKYSLIDLDRRLIRMSARKKRVYKEMVPLFFYKNLLAQSNRSSSSSSSSSSILLKPGQLPSSVEDPSPENRQFIIQPVYGSSHNPLKLIFLEQKKRTEFTISFHSYRGEIGLREKDPASSGHYKAFKIYIEEESSLWDGIQYLILSIIRRFAKSTKKNQTPKGLASLLFEYYNDLSSSEEIEREMKELSENRLDVLEKDILFAVKLVQLYNSNGEESRESLAKRSADLLDKMKESYRKAGVKDRDAPINTLINMITDYHQVMSQ